LMAEIQQISNLTLMSTYYSQGFTPPGGF